MHETLTPLYRLPLTEPTTTKAVRFTESPIARHPETSVILNSRFALPDNPSELLRYIWLPGQGTQATDIPFFGSGPGTRGRELGNAGDPFFIMNQETGYKTLGILTIKSAGMRGLDTAVAEINEMTHPASAGVSGIDESFKDSGYGDILDEAGAVIGNTIAIISTTKEAFLEHFENGELVGPTGLAYAARMREAWQNDHEYRPRLNMQIRHTDPERMAFGFFARPDLLRNSVSWMRRELVENTADTLAKHYGVQFYDIEHLLTQDDGETEHAQARLLAYTIIRNLAIAVSLNVDASFKLKEMGSLGKLHDFSVATVDDTGELPRATANFAALLNEEFRHPDSLLSEEDIQEVFDLAEEQTGVQLTRFRH